ncbi:hypothetical protein C479_07191 [Halovivax asiaticus JCM 14624]|uniref:DUF5658 domain-containing protein n=1 Tax=Halovivax asiaticus JCM 14624 TaxID=1227490 RepID=M0BPV3_9EURY|nr:hypothetical protein [Halovivax asiaticus]ELZ11629.1 hypothetical protein C479_07191 [Halovivax asiaticus JCM 14624]
MTTWFDATPRYDEYWDWAAVVLFLFLTLDLLLSVLAAGTVGLGYERNPLMAWLYGQSLWIVVAGHVSALVVLAGFFHALFSIVRALPRGYRGPVALAVEIFLGGLLAAGFLLLANNVAVIVLGEGLL